MLRCFVRANGPLPLKAIASESDMLAGKTHRYLRSFIAAGFVVQDAATRLYDLGPLAYAVGAAGLRRYDVVRSASTHLVELRMACGESASLMIWGDASGVVIRSEEGSNDVSIMLRVGSPIRLVTSSAGRIFAAYLPREIVEPVLAAEFAERPVLNGRRIKRADYTAALDKVRAKGICVLRDGPVPGAAAISTPLFGPDGRLLAAASVVGRTGKLDERPDGPIARELRAFCRRMEHDPV